MTTTKSISLSYKEGSSDKVYHAQLEESGDKYIVNFQYGRRGSSLASGTKTQSSVDYPKADKIFDKLVHDKMNKGYKLEGTTAKAFVGVKEVAVKNGKRLFVPQLLNFIEETEVERYLTDDDYGMEEKRDGERVSFKTNQPKVQAFNKLGKDRAFPIHFESDFTHKGQFDGELIGDIFYAFDLLEYGTEDLRGDRYESRKSSLDSLDFNSPNIVVVKTYKGTTEKRKAYKRLKKENAEGIVFKLLDGKSKGGRPNKAGDQVKFKFYKEASVIVIKVNDKRSVQMGVLTFFAEGNTDEIAFVGNVTIPPNKEIPPVGALIEVRYLYAYKGGSLFQPTFKSDRSHELNRSECVCSQLVYKQE